MDAKLSRIIDACIAGERLPNVGRTDITLRSTQTFDRSHLIAFEELLDYAESSLGVQLEPVGGGYGCASFNFRVSDKGRYDALNKRWMLLHDPAFLAGAQAAGFDSLLTRNPRGYVNLKTGATYDGPRDSRLLFCSYSHLDTQLQRQMKSHFSPLKLVGCSAVWFDDNDILPGGAVHDEIQEHLQNSSMILLLVSADFFDSTYIMEYEVPIALERHSQRAATVIPVILRPVKWEITPLGRLKALPEHGKPVTQWDTGIDAAMLNVVNGVLSVLGQD